MRAFTAVMMIPNAWRLMWQIELGDAALLILAMLSVLTVVLCIAFWGGVSKRWPRARHSLRRLPKGDLLERSLDSCRQFGKEKKFLVQTVAVSFVLNTVWVLQIIVLG